MRDTFVSELQKLAYDNPEIILITGDLGFGVLIDFSKCLPNQFINAGVAEQNMTGLASGMALDGKIVFTYSIANFNTLRCLEQIRNDACYHELNVNIISVGGGFSYGPLGYSHHATEDVSILRSIPNLEVFTPSNCNEVKGIVNYMVNNNGVKYLRIDKSNVKEHNLNNVEFKYNEATIYNEGKDLCIIGYGGILNLALEASAYFKDKGITIKVIGMHSIKPYDEKTIIDCALNTGGIITLEEHSVIGGIGSLVCEVLMKNHVLPKRFEMLAIESKFSSHVGSQDYLRGINNIGIDSIKNAVYKMLNIN